MEDKGYADVNGTRLYYEVAGSGYPVVLVHGFTLDLRMWDDQVEALAPHYQVIRYDSRGHGKSVPPGSDGFYHADDLKGLLDYLGVKKAHVIGLSLGAAIAIEFVLAYPDMASSLVAADAVLWGFPWSPEYEADLGKIWEAGQSSGAEGARSVWLAHPFFAPALANPRSAARLVEIVSNYSGWHWTHNDPGLLPDPVGYARLDEIMVPTLALIGEYDLPDFHAVTDVLSTQISNARKVVLPGAGHMSNMEDPEAFNRAVLDFLGGI